CMRILRSFETLLTARSHFLLRLSPRSSNPNPAANDPPPPRPPASPGRVRAGVDHLGAAHRPPAGARGDRGPRRIPPRRRVIPAAVLAGFYVVLYLPFL